jgi:hypothetical protein
MNTCSVEGCPKPKRRRLYCAAHEARWRKYGDPTYTKYVDRLNGASDEDRLRNIGWDVTESGCWEWRGARDPGGYGRMQSEHRGIQSAHCISYETWIGPIEPGNEVRHYVCANPPCVNPRHLRQGNHRAYPGMPKHKLTREDVLVIRELSEQGMNNAELAAQFGVVRATIRNVVTRRTWKHV